jgi:tRNA G18 (ribose-2'-O)-methylase SpoU
MPVAHVEPLASSSHPDVALFSTLRRRRGLEREARFVAEGDKVVERLFDSDFAVESLLTTAAALPRWRARVEARPEPVRVFVAADADEVRRLVGFADDSTKAVGRVVRPRSLDETTAGTPSPRLFVALDGLTNAENVGSVVRNAAAMGAHAVVVGETSCSPFVTRAIRTSMGAVFRVPVVEREPLVASLARLRAAGVRCVAAHPAGATPLPRVDLARDVCLVLGSEGDGVSRAVLAACDESASIPMSAGVDSLNVASASAVVLYEALRQRAAMAP